MSARDVDATVKVSFDKPGTGGGIYSSLVVRRIGTSDYRLKVRIEATAVTLFLVRTVNGTEVTLANQRIAGLVYQPGQVLRLRLQATGTGTTTLRGRLWVDGATEPTAWNLTTTDTTAALQNPGAVGSDHLSVHHGDERAGHGQLRRVPGRSLRRTVIVLAQARAAASRDARRTGRVNNPPGPQTASPAQRQCRRRRIGLALVRSAASLPRARRRWRASPSSSSRPGTSASDGLGEFAVLFGVIVVATAVSSGFVGDSLTVLDRRRSSVRAGLQWWLAMLALGAGVIGVAVAVLAGFLSPAEAVAFGLATGHFLVEDTLRRLLMATMQFWRIVFVDIAAMVASLAVVVVAAAKDGVTLGVMLFALAVGQVVGDRRRMVAAASSRALPRTDAGCCGSARSPRTEPGGRSNRRCGRAPSPSCG